MNKKVISAFLALAAALTSAGCGKREAAQTGDAKITWLVQNDSQADVSLVNEEATKMLREKGIDADFELQFVDNAAYNERMNMYMASGADFDICFTGYVNPYLNAVQKGGFYELDELLKDSKINEEIPEFYLKNAGDVNGHIYGIPNMQIMTSCTGLFILKDLADEYGLKKEDIKSLDDIEPFLAWVKEKHPEKYPFRNTSYGGGWKETVQMDQFAKCIRVLSKDDGSYEARAMTDWDSYWIEGRKVCDWYNKGYIRHDITTVVDDSLELSSGKYACWRGAYKPGVEEENNDKKPDAQSIVIPLGVSYVTAGEGRNAMTAINAKSKNPELAFKVVELANTDKDFYNLLCYGIKDKHYKLTDDGKAETISNSGYTINGNWKVGSVFNSYPLISQSADVWEETKKFNEEGKKSNLIGFTFDTNPVRTQIAQIEGVLDKYQFDPTANQDEFEANFKNALKEAGMYEILDEVKNQLSEWEKNK